MFNVPSNDSGGNDSNDIPINKILEFNPETEAWTKIGTMKVATGDHRLSIVDYRDYADMCN